MILMATAEVYPKLGIFLAQLGSLWLMNHVRLHVYAKMMAALWAPNISVTWSLCPGSKNCHLDLGSSQDILAGLSIKVVNAIINMVPKIIHFLRRLIGWLK